MAKNETGYPSIDKTHEEGLSFSQKHPVIPNMSIYNALKYMSLFYRKNEAIDCLKLSVTYDELIKNSVIIARSFKEIGIKKDDIVTVSMPNFYQAVAIYLAANQIGAVTTFLNSSSSINEVKHYLNLFESPLLVNYDCSQEYNDEIKKDTKVRNVITLSKCNLYSHAFNPSYNHLCEEFYKRKKNLSTLERSVYRQILEKAKSPFGYNDCIDFGDLESISHYYSSIYKTNYSGKENSLISFTSGSTGNPKAVVLTNENILSSGIYMKKTINLPQERNERCLVCVPFCYPYGFATSTIMTLLCGRVAVLAPDLSKNNINYYLNKNNNYIFGTPALLELMKQKALPIQDLSSIHTFISGGDFLTPKKIMEGKAFFKDHGSDVSICNGSGNAETAATSTSSVGSEMREDTVGRLLVGSDGIIITIGETTGNLIIDDNTGVIIGSEKKYGEEGVLCVTGKHVFREYYKRPDLTKKAKFTYKGREYFITETLGKLDKDRYFTLTGRSSRFYINITETQNKVYCDKVQNIISLIDVVDSCAVVERNDEENLLAGVAYIVLKPGIPETDETIEYIKKRCHERFLLEDHSEIELLSYEIPSDFHFIKEFPLTKADKIDYETLKKQAQVEREEAMVLKKSF